MTLLDVEWRKRLEFAAFHYAEAKRAVLCATNDAKAADECCAVEKTVAAETEALREYTRVLAIFARLVLDKQPPPPDEELEYSELPQSSDSSHVSC